ncbi:hypothetical protein H2203_005390 [Taxawa tesnikishii (nom. ined.)]|nr:hypothetical protein H2203_005390 [Dothideales sp. JES 119]
MAQKPVLISGAGLASLLLGRSLLRSGIPFHIYERDASLAFRGQGYRLRLSAEGLDAIESALEPAAFRKFWDRCGKTGGSGFAAFDAVTGEQTEQNAPGSGSDGKGTGGGGGGGGEKLTSREGKTIGIARGDMRNLFMEGCEEFVHFSKNVKGYELTDDGVKAIFADGTNANDGIQRIGEGVFRIVDNTKADGQVGVITNVRPDDMDDPNVQFGWTMVGSPGVIKAPNDDYTVVGKTAADLAKSLTAGWDKRFKPLFENLVESEAAFWKITCSTPSGVPEWPNNPRVTVIGDAAHSMTPAGGIGANTAVRDSALLGRLLGEAGGSKEGVTAAYEKEMRVYASEAVKTSYGMATKAFKVHIDEETSQTLGPQGVGDWRSKEEH